jgi:hypothetical protein
MSTLFLLTNMCTDTKDRRSGMSFTLSEECHSRLQKNRHECELGHIDTYGQTDIVAFKGDGSRDAVALPAPNLGGLYGKRP